MPRSEHIFDKAFLGLDRKKYEIMLNDTCVYNCKHYGEHFKKIAEKNRVVGNPFKIFAKKVGPAKPTYFIRNAVQSGRNEAGTVARGVISTWLTK